jgi:putative ABC transport system permease protein
MRVTTSIKRAGRSLRAAKARTFLTSLAIAVGAFSLTMSLAAGEGARQYADKLISSNFDPAQLTVAKDKKIFGADTSGFNKPQEYDDTLISEGQISVQRLTQADIEKIAAQPGVETVVPRYSPTPQYVTAPGMKKYVATVQAYNPSQLPDLEAGALPSSGQLKTSEALLPDSFLDILGFASSQDAIGKTITLHFNKQVSLDTTKISQLIQTQGLAGLNGLASSESKDMTLTISGVTKKAATALTSTGSIFIAESQAKSLDEYLTEGTSSYQKYIIASVHVKNGENEQVLEKVQAQLKGLGYNVQSVKDTEALLTSFINTLLYIVLGFSIVALIASIFGIVNTQYISVLERTREIGLMKALGMRRRTVLLLFLLEAGWIGLLGGLLGALLGYLAGLALNPVLNKLLDLGAGSNLLIFVPWQIISLIVGLILVGIFAGLLPAWKAARLDPIEALRTE